LFSLYLLLPSPSHTIDDLSDSLDNKSQSLRIIESLIAHGANINKASRGYNPLDYTLILDDFEVFALLYRNGVVLELRHVHDTDYEEKLSLWLDCLKS
jgi:ankyrin repeat protein